MALAFAGRVAELLGDSDNQTKEAAVAYFERLGWGFTLRTSSPPLVASLRLTFDFVWDKVWEQPT